MLTKPNAIALYRKLCRYSKEALLSKEGRALQSKAIACVKRLEGRAEARILSQLLASARAV